MNILKAWYLILLAFALILVMSCKEKKLLNRIICQ